MQQLFYAALFNSKRADSWWKQKKKKKDAVCHLGKKKVKQIIRMWNFYECLKTV